MPHKSSNTLTATWKTTVLRTIWLLALCLALSQQQELMAQTQGGFEQKTTLNASSLLNANLLKSNLYTIDEEVINDGLLNHFTVRSVYGIFKPNSTQGTIQLLHEIQAIDAMRRVETQETVKESVVQSGKNTVDAVANLVTDPQGTIEGAAAGVSSLFYRASQSVGKRDATSAEDSKLEQFIGKSKSKGEIANKYGVSVYSQNQVLQEELERLAWADYLGGIGVGLAQSAVPGAGGLLLTASGTTRLLNEVINTTPASELWVRNKNKLEAMGIDSDTAQLFLNNPSFTPALQTIMADALESMQGVANRALFIKISLQANSTEMAQIITKIATMAAGYHKNVAPLQGFSPFGRFLYATSKKGSAVLLFPADHLLWTARVADAASWLHEPGQKKASGYELWILGDFSKKGQEELKKLGWDLHPNAQSTLFPQQKKKS